MKIIKIGIMLLVSLVILLSASPVFAGDASGGISVGVDTGVGGVVKAAPTATPAAGTYSSAQSVTLTAGGSTAIYYTVNGTAPSNSAGSLYTSAISVATSTTIKSVAYYADGSPGPAGTASYTISSGGGGGGGGGGGAPPGPAVVTGGSVPLTFNPSGFVIYSVQLQGQNREFTLTVPAGIQATVNNQPVSAITATVLNLAALPPAPSSSAILLACDFGPSGAAFSLPGITLAMTYDLATLPAGVVENQLYIADLLEVALRQHLPRSPIWSYMLKRQSLQRKSEEQLQVIKGVIEQAAKEDSRLESLITAGLDGVIPGIVTALVAQARQWSHGSLGLNLEDNLAVEPAGDGFVKLRWGYSQMGKMDNEHAEAYVKIVLAVLEDLQSNLREWEAYRDLEKTILEIERLRRKLREELAVIRLRRIVPGRCKYCPL